MIGLQRLSEVRPILAAARVIAVLGAHSDLGRPAGYVPAYLYAQGYRVLPVNPRLVGERLFGEPVRRALSEIEEPIDIVDIFRRSEDLPAHLPELLGLAPLPRVVWLQQGIVNDTFAAALVAVGITVVQSRCTLADHRALGLPPVGD